MTVDSTFIADTKKAMRITTDSFDGEISDLLNAALLDLGVAGVTVPASADFLVKQAAITYTKLHFGEVDPNVHDRLSASYNEQKAQLATCTGYTEW